MGLPALQVCGKPPSIRPDFLQPDAGDPYEPGMKNQRSSTNAAMQSSLMLRM